MAGVVADSVVVELIAKIDKYERDFKRAGDTAERELARIRKAAAKPITIASTQGGGARGGATGNAGAAAAEARAARDAIALTKAKAQAEREASRVTQQAARTAREEQSLATAQAREQERAIDREIALARDAAREAERAADRQAAAAARVAQAEREAARDVARANREAQEARERTAREAERTADREAAAARRAANDAARAERELTRAQRDAARERDRIADRERSARERAQRDSDRAAAAEMRRLRELERARERAANEERRRQDAAARQTERLRAQQAQIRSAILGLAATAGVYFGARELIEITDKYTQFTNTLRVAGVESANFGTVQDALFASAQKYGVELNALGGLYGKVAQATSELGASQQDILKFTDGVAAALKVQGGSTEAASGALLQLGQALQSGTVRAEEYNSINEGAFPILQAAAAGSEKYRGSVAALRADVIAGTVSSKDFFQAFLAGSSTLEEKAAKAALTTAAGFVTLQNALEVYIGEANQASGISAALGEGLKTLANNLEVLIPAIAIVTTAIGVGLVTSLARAAIAARGVGPALLGAFGGPVGLAITAIIVGIAAFGTEVSRTNAIVERTQSAYSELQERLRSTAIAASQAGSGAKGVGVDALGAIPRVNAFAGAVGALAQQLYGQARAARVARIELLQKNLADSKSTEIELGKNTAAGRDDERRRSGALFRAGDISGALGIAYSTTIGATNNLLSGGRVDRATQRARGQQAAISGDIQRRLDDAKRAPISPSDLPPVSRVAPPPSGGDGRSRGGAGSIGGGASGASAETARQRAIREERSFSSDQSKLNRSILEAKQDYAFDAATDVKLQKDRIDEEGRNERDRIESEVEAGKYGKDSAERGKTLLALNGMLIAERKKAVDTEVEFNKAQDEVSSKKAGLDLEAELERSTGQLATTTKARRDSALRILDIQYQQERIELQAVVDNVKAKDVDRNIARLRLAQLDRLKGGDAAVINQQNEGPLASFRRQNSEQYADLDETVQGIEVGILQEVSDTLADAAKSALGLSGALGNVVGQIIQIGIQRRLIGPLADALFGKSDGSSSGALGGILKSVVGAVSGSRSGSRATGGDVTSGKPYLIGERGPELFVPGGSGKIIPTGRVNSNRDSGTTVIAPQQFDLRGVVMTETLVRQLQVSNRNYANQVATRAGKTAYDSSPSRSQRLSTLGT